MRSRWRQLGLRSRLALALAAVAVLSVGLATVLANAGLHSRLDQFAEARLQDSARHSADLGASLYRQSGHWTQANVAELGHLAAMNGYRLTLLDPAGRPLGGQRSAERSHATATASRATATAAVVSDGRKLGSVVITPQSGNVMSGEYQELSSRLNRLHLVAAALALGLGVLAALLLAPLLARPLRRLTAAAGQVERGDLEVRVPPTGPAETTALARAINNLTDTLQREEQIRRAAAADIAHELRTPLTGIVSRIEAAQDGVLPDEQHNLEAMHTEALRLVQLVADMGKLADAERPGLTIAKQDVDLAALVSERTNGYRERLAAKDIELIEQIAPTRAWGDADRITQILENLLSNALRYTNPGGTVTVALSQRGREATIVVSDTGVGIRGEDLAYIFERFWRAEQSRARRTGGAGIGLAIVRELVRAHNGRIDVHSQPGYGSRFTVTLPGRPPTG